MGIRRLEYSKLTECVISCLTNVQTIPATVFAFVFWIWTRFVILFGAIWSLLGQSSRSTSSRTGLAYSSEEDLAAELRGS